MHSVNFIACAPQEELYPLHPPAMMHCISHLIVLLFFQNNYQFLQDQVWWSGYSEAFAHWSIHLNAVKVFCKWYTEKNKTRGVDLGITSQENMYSNMAGRDLLEVYTLGCIFSGKSQAAMLCVTDIFHFKATQEPFVLSAIILFFIF